MTKIILHDDLFDELVNASSANNAFAQISDDEFSIGGATFKRYVYVPTPEDISRREEFLKTPLGQITQMMFQRSAAAFLEETARTNELLASGQIKTILKIRMPKDYTNAEA